MEMTHIFGLLAALLMLAYVANRLSGLTRVPDLIVLLLIGVMLGPILHWVPSTSFQGVIDVFGTLALILILFSGGVELRLRQAARHAPAALLLMVLSYGLSLGLIALMGRAFLHLQWSDCILLGAALGCTSGTIVIPALEQITAAQPVKIALTLESTLGEVIAVLLIGSLLDTGVSQSLVFGVAANFSHHIVIALLLGVATGAIWSKLWPMLANQPNTSILNLGVVFGVYALARYFNGSGLLAVLIFGVTLANLPRTPHTTRQGARLLAFHAELSFLVRSFFFVLLGIVAEFASRTYLLPIVGILVALAAGPLPRRARQPMGGTGRDAQADGVIVLDAAARAGDRCARAGDCQRPRAGVCLPAGNGIHRHPGDQLVCGGWSREIGEDLGARAVSGCEALRDGRVETPNG